MYRAFLSWRYLRARRANWIGIVGIGVGVGAMILILSIMAGFLEENRRMVRGSLSDLIIAPIMAQRDDGKTIPTDPEPILEVVRADPRVEAACAQLVYGAILTQEGRDATLTDIRLSDPQNSELAAAQLLGIDVEDELRTTELREALVKEPLFGGTLVANPDRPFDPPPGYRPEGRPLASVVVGEQLFDTWRLTRGAEINLITAVQEVGTDEYVPNNMRFVVAGTCRSSDNELDGQRIYMERAELMKFIGPARSFSQILVKLKDYENDHDAVQLELERKLYDAGLIYREPDPDYKPREVKTWEDFRQVLLGAIENERVLMAIMLSLVIVVAGFTVFAILSMMVTEKRRDVGILSALGATPGGVTVLFLMIAFWDWILGAIAGAVLGTWGALKIDAIERWLSSTLRVEIFDRRVYLFDHIPSVVDPFAISAIVLGAFLCVVLFAAIPAWKAGRLHPLDALRYE